MAFVCASYRPLKIGSVIESPVIDSLKEKHPKQPVYIRREATREEWEESVREGGGEPEGPTAPYYYEISTD